MKNLLNKFWPRKTPEVKSENPPLRRFKIKTRQEVNGLWQDVDAWFETNAPEKDFYLCDPTGFGIFCYKVHYFDENAVVYDTYEFFGVEKSLEKDIESLSVDDFWRKHLRDNINSPGMLIETDGGPNACYLTFKQVGAQ